MEGREGHEWYQSILGIMFLYISSELLKIFKGPGPLNLKISGLKVHKHEIFF
jgi:hypothetical protein